jgi:general L-amino acid transport system permease protein
MSVRSKARPVGPKPPFWRDRAKRALFFQALLVTAVALFLLYIIGNTQDNLAARGITTGFGFLERTAGFGIGQSLIEYSSQSTYGRTFVVGLLNTLLVSALGIVAATIVGFIVGIARLSPNWLIARLASGYIEIFRNIPCCCRSSSGTSRCCGPCPVPGTACRLGKSSFSTCADCSCPSRCSSRASA